jgi:hypothetical protein
MIHIAIQEQLDGKRADWMEKVSDEQYEGVVKITSDMARRSRCSATGRTQQDP